MKAHLKIIVIFFCLSKKRDSSLLAPPCLVSIKARVGVGGGHAGAEAARLDTLAGRGHLVAGRLGHVRAVEVVVVAGVGRGRGHAPAEATRLETLGGNVRLEAGRGGQLSTIGIGVVAGVGRGWGQAGAQAARLETILRRVRVVAQRLSQEGTVGVGVVARVRLGRHEALTEAAGEDTIAGNVGYVAGGDRQIGAVGVHVKARLVGHQDLRIDGPGLRLTRDDDNGAADAAGASAPSQFDVTILAPVDAPTVLEQPVVRPVLRPIADNRDGVRRLPGALRWAAWTTVKDPAAPVHVKGGKIGIDGAEHSAIHVDQRAEQRLRPTVGVVGGIELGTLVIHWHVAGTAQLGRHIQIRILGLGSEGSAPPNVGKVAEVGVGRRTVAACRAVMAVAAVDELLLGVVADHAGDLAEAGLDGGDAGKGRTGAALELVLHRAHQA